MTEKNIQAFADDLFNAEQTRIQIQPLTETDSSLTVDDAYAIQMANIARAEAMGHVISGKKIGLTSVGIQTQLGVHEPDYGHLFAAMDCVDGKADCSQLIQPKIEAEIAFVLAADLVGGEVTAEDVRAATDYVVGAFEIVDSRVDNWRIKLPDTVADNASSGRYVLGKEHFNINDVDLPTVSMKLYKNGELMETGTGSEVLGDPAVSVAWLANKLWGYGVTLKKGEVVLSGAFSAAPVAVKGDKFRVDFTTFGTLEAEFV